MTMSLKPLITGLLVAAVAALALAGPAAASPGALKILVVYADFDGPTTLKGWLLAQPGVSVVDTMSAESATPSLSTLQGYDEVIVFSGDGFADAATLGDNLADYYDGGGVVAEAVFDWDGVLSPGTPSLSPGGRWSSGGYSPLVVSDASGVDSARSLEARDFSDPLLQGVNSLTTEWWHDTTAAPGATVIGNWDNGAPALARKGHALAVNGYVGNTVANPSQLATGDYGPLFVNAANALGPHVLTVAKAGNGSGRVLSAPGGIECGSVCAARYPGASQVTLTAAPSNGSTFSGWSGGGCSGPGSCTLTLFAAQNVTATFTAPAGSATPGSGTSGSRSRAAIARLLAHTVSISLKTGKGTERASCANVAGDRCAIELALQAPASSRASTSRAKKHIQVGSVRGTIAGGKTGPLQVRLTRKGRALLKESKTLKLRVRAVGQSKNTAGSATAVRQTLLLRAAKKRH
jgi:hypothetical protein